MKKVLKRVKRFVDFFLKEHPDRLGNEWRPKFEKRLAAVAVSSRQPLGGNKYDDKLMHITEWWNGEGWDISCTTNDADKMYSLHMDEVELLLKGLDKLGYFKFDKDDV